MSPGRSLPQFNIGVLGGIQGDSHTTTPCRVPRSQSCCISQFFIVPCETYFTASPSDLAKLLRPTFPEISSFKSYCYFEPRYLYNYYLEEEAVKGDFIQATVFAKPRLCNLGNKTKEQQGAQTLTL
ncbi:hypothetical protein TNCV_4752091 [Trichonephila clavipes]|nr:hypothetical protein TNCV_4752091 [Trichonephila clavipes]